MPLSAIFSSIMSHYVASSLPLHTCERDHVSCERDHVSCVFGTFELASAILSLSPSLCPAHFPCIFSYFPCICSPLPVESTLQAFSRLFNTPHCCLEPHCYLSCVYVYIYMYMDIFICKYTCIYMYIYIYIPMYIVSFTSLPPFSSPAPPSPIFSLCNFRICVYFGLSFSSSICLSLRPVSVFVSFSFVSFSLIRTYPCIHTYPYIRTYP